MQWALWKFSTNVSSESVVWHWNCSGFTSQGKAWKLLLWEIVLFIDIAMTYLAISSCVGFLHFVQNAASQTQNQKR